VPRLIWSPAALNDAQRLFRFLANRDEAAARRAIKTIRVGVKLLAYQPEAGRPIEGLASDFREWPIDFGDSVYIALYRYDGDSVIILAVRHQKESGIE